MRQSKNHDINKHIEHEDGQKGQTNSQRTSFYSGIKLYKLFVNFASKIRLHFSGGVNKARVKCLTKKASANNNLVNHQHYPQLH